jgi:hypothetical protein
VLVDEAAVRARLWVPETRITERAL